MNLGDSRYEVHVMQLTRVDRCEFRVWRLEFLVPLLPLEHASLKEGIKDFIHILTSLTARDQQRIGRIKQRDRVRHLRHAAVTLIILKKKCKKVFHSTPMTSITPISIRDRD